MRRVAVQELPGGCWMYNLFQKLTAEFIGTFALIFFGAVNPDFRHFRQLFKGRFLQQDCEYAGCYHETTKPEGAVCRLVGHQGIPKCSLHSTEYVLRNIDAVVRDYHITTQATPPRLSATS